MTKSFQSIIAFGAFYRLRIYRLFASWANNIMLGRLGQPEDVAGVVSFLCSIDAAFMTAETLQVGGGQALGIYSD